MRYHARTNGIQTRHSLKTHEWYLCLHTHEKLNHMHFKLLRWIPLFKLGFKTKTTLKLIFTCSCCARLLCFTCFVSFFIELHATQRCNVRLFHADFCLHLFIKQKRSHDSRMLYIRSIYFSLWIENTHTRIPTADATVMHKLSPIENGNKWLRATHGKHFNIRNIDKLR